MKLPYKFVAVILIGIGLSFFALNLAFAQGDFPCWCCIQTPTPHVIQTTAADCNKKHGHCYTSQRQAEIECSKPLKCWCCNPTTHQVSYIPTSQCERMHGHCYANGEDAYRACHPKR
jgi:hypothetical protein